MISKSDFLSAVDLIHSTLFTSSSSTSSQIVNLPIFANTETNKLALLSPNGRKSRLQALMGMLSEQGMSALTDDELLDGSDGSEHSNTDRNKDGQKPPPIPPRTKSIPSMLLDTAESSSKHKASTVDPIEASPPLPPKRLPWPSTVSESSLNTSTALPTNINGMLDLKKASILRPPPLPRDGQTTITSTRTSNTSTRTSNTSTSTSSTSSTQRRSAQTSPQDTFQYSGQYYTVGRADSDSDSSDDFVPFIPPKRSRYASEPFVNQKVLLWQRERRASSPLPDANKELKKSSPILTKRPVWYSKPDKRAISRKYQSEVSFSTTLSQIQRCEEQSVTLNRKLKYRSHSLDGKTGFTITPRQSAVQSAAGAGNSPIYESDDNTGGTMESKDYSKPFEHILWRKLGLDDGSALSGSLPHLDKVTANDLCDSEDDPEGCTYLDPKELEDYCEKLGDKELSTRIRTRLSTVLSSTYLSLSDAQDAVTSKIYDSPFTEEASSLPTQAFPLPPPKNNSPSLAAFGTGSMERFKRNVELTDSFYSGYSTDASSGWGEPDFEGCWGQLQNLAADNPYDEVKASLENPIYSENNVVESMSRNTKGKEGGEAEDLTEGEQIYEEIGEYSDSNMQFNLDTNSPDRVPCRHTHLHISHSVPEERYVTDSLPRHKSVSSPRSNGESPYASLKELSGQLRLKRAPTLPPRPAVRRLASQDPGHGRRKHYFRNDSKGAGVRI